MRFSQKKFEEKLKQQELTNPGNKAKYDAPFRGRPVVFRDRSKYNRQASKQEVRKEIDQYLD